MTYTIIGQTLKAHGIKGELKLAIYPEYLDDFLDSTRVFIDIKGVQLPYFIREIRGTNDLIVQFEDVNDRDIAALLQHKPVSLRASEVTAPPTPVSTDSPDPLTGYKIVDEDAGELGTIQSLEYPPQQIIALVDYNGKTIMIPINDHFVVHVDHDKKSLLMRLPEGLIDL
jgi:16S rRNA processing protein RimM